MPDWTIVAIQFGYIYQKKQQSFHLRAGIPHRILKVIAHVTGISS